MMLEQSCQEPLPPRLSVAVHCQSCGLGVCEDSHTQCHSPDYPRHPSLSWESEIPKSEEKEHLMYMYI